jgi:DNA primase
MRMPDEEFRALVDAARDRHLLSDIVGRHTTLKKRGARELVGLCCFHQERTPSLEINDSKGTYYCHGCGSSGDAYRFLMRQEGMTFRQAYETLAGDEFPIISEEERAKRKAEDERLTAARIELARSIWGNSVPLLGTIGERYVRGRGITADLPDTVRFVMAPRWRNEETGEVGRDYPAVVCAGQDVNDAVTAVQCIFLSPDGRTKFERVRDDGTKAKAKLTWGILAGSALRFGPPAEHVVCCEGPEDGWTLMQKLPDKSVWAAGGTALMARVIWPPIVQSVCFAGDNGAAGVAAVENAKTAALEQNVKARGTYPPPEFKDWNDQLRGISR